MPRRNIDWKKAAAELIVIIVGEMLALAADRWRQELREGDLATSYLDRVSADIEVDLNAYRTVVVWSNAIDEAASYVIGIYRGREVPTDERELFLQSVLKASWLQTTRGIKKESVYSLHFAGVHAPTWQRAP